MSNQTQKMIERFGDRTMDHAELLAEWARCRGIANAYSGADENPYADHLQTAREALPASVTRRSFEAAAILMERNGFGRYASNLSFLKIKVEG